MMLSEVIHALRATERSPRAGEEPSARFMRLTECVGRLSEDEDAVAVLSAWSIHGALDWRARRRDVDTNDGDALFDFAWAGAATPDLREIAAASGVPLGRASLAFERLISAQLITPDGGMPDLARMIVARHIQSLK